jgi:hypothetical protein
MLDMPMKYLSVFSVAACLALAACGDEVPTRPDVEDGLTTSEAGLDVLPPNVAAFARGGGTWDLNLGDLDGDGADDPINNVLGISAVRYEDGTVEGQMEYKQRVFGLSFDFHGPVTCIGVYDDGTRAKFGGPITRSNDPDIPVGVFMWFTVVDNGQGAGSPPDRSSILGIGNEQANEDFCASDAPPNPTFSADLTSGNIDIDG